MPLQYPRYNKVYELTCQFILENNLTSFPLNLTDIVTAKGWRLMAATTASNKLGITHSDFIKGVLLESDAKTWITSKGYLIVYNNTNKPLSRTRWTLAHEVGHIVLGHLDGEWGLWMEKEADYFAANLLAPFGVMKRCGIEHTFQIEKYFGLSKEAAKNRNHIYNKWNEKKHTNKNDLKIIEIAKYCIIPQTILDFGKIIRSK